MADYFKVEIYVTGDSNAVDHFIAGEFDGQHKLRDDTVRFSIEDFDLNHIGGGEQKMLFISGDQAWDSAEVWVRKMREKYPQLEIEGLVQTWDSF